MQTLPPYRSLSPLLPGTRLGRCWPASIETLLPRGHAAHGMAELFDLTSFTGSIEVTSTEPIVSLSLNFEADPVFSSLPPGELDASAQGSTTYYFPHLAVGKRVGKPRSPISTTRRGR